MASSADLYTLALAEAQLAVEHDDEGRVPEAIASYERALALISQATAVDSDAEHRQVVAHESQRYTVRVSLLRSLQGGAAEGQGGAVPGRSAGSAGSRGARCAGQAGAGSVCL